MRAMQGQQDSQRILFDTIDLERLIPDDHVLRRIDASIDFDFIYKVTEGLYGADNGRNSIDPVLFFRMQLISYLSLLNNRFFHFTLLLACSGGGVHRPF
jgi:transposase